MASIYDWSLTAADNATADADINWQENQPPDTVNNSARQMMTRVAELLDDLGAVADSTGSGNTYAVTAQSGITAYARGITISFKADKTNTGAATLNVNGIGDVALNTTTTGALAAGQIRAGGVYYAIHDGTRFLLLNAGAGTVTIENLEAGVLGRLMQPGFMMPWFNDTVPNDAWVFAEGQAISRTTYAPLFGQWGTIFGAGDGSLTFNVIDMRGEFLRGLDTTATADPDAASRTDRGDGTTGANAGTKQADQTRSHTHGVSGATDSAGNHTHSIEPRAAETASNIGTDGAGTLSASGGAASTQAAGAHTHPFSTTSDATGGSETRPRNIACRWIVLANPALAADALNLSGLSGFGLAFDTSVTMGDPGLGQLRYNNATPSLVTSIAIDDQSSDTGNPDFSAAVATWDDSTSTIKGVLKISKANAPEVFAVYQLTALTDNNGWAQLTVTHVVSNGSFLDGDAIRVDFTRNGDAGISGNDGGIRWTFDTNTTTSADPGAGDLRLNNAALASVTEIGLSANSAETGNPDTSDFVVTWDDSTTTGNRGQILIARGDANENFAVYQINGAITDNGTHLQIPVAHIASNGTFTNGSNLSVQFSRTGDLGATGAAGADGSDAGIRYAFDASTVMAEPGDGDLRLNNAAFASVTAIAFDDNAGETGNPDVSAWLLTFDDITNATTRGRLIVKEIATPQNFAVFNVTSLTDNTTWVQVNVSHVASNGSFAASDALSVQFVPAGNDGAGAVDFAFRDITGDSGTTIVADAAADVLAVVGGAGIDTSTNGTNDTLTIAGSAASETASGIVELATNAETQTGTDTARAITPANLTAKEASTAQFRNNTADRILTTDQVWSGAALVTLTDAATIAVDMDSGFNFQVTLAGNRTLGNPTNVKIGQAGMIIVNQDGTGSRTLGYSANWEFPGGVAPTLTTTASAKDILTYFAQNSSRIIVTGVLRDVS